MATVRTVSVHPTGGPGAATYTSLAAAEAAEQGNLVTADTQLNIVCYAMADAPATFEGWTVDATRYVQITVAAGNRHAGVWDTSKYYITGAVTGDGVLVVTDPYIYVDGVQAMNTDPAPSGNGSAIRMGGSPSGEQRVSNSIGRGGRYVIRFDAGMTVFYGWNLIAYGNVVAGGGFALGSPGSLYNCVAIGGVANASGFFQFTSPGVTMKNCYGLGTGASTAYAGTITKTTCASADATGSAGLTSIPFDTTTFTNVSPGSEDFRLPVGSALINAGTNTSGDAAPMDFTTDIAGRVRPGTWDIGAWEYIAPVAPSSGRRRILRGCLL